MLVMILLKSMAEQRVYEIFGTSNPPFPLCLSLAASLLSSLQLGESGQGGL